MPTGRNKKGKEEHVRTIAGLADRLLGLVAPRLTAAANTEFCSTTECFCSNHRQFVRTCCLINDHFSCTPCQLSGASC